MANVQTYKQNTNGVENVKQRPAVAPRVDIYENDLEYLVYADLPGVSKEDMVINIHRDELTVEGTRKTTVEGSGLSGEFRPVDFRRSFALPRGVDREKVDAELVAGVLCLHLPKSETSRPRQIKIRSA